MTTWGRVLIAPGLALVLSAASLAAAELPRNEEEVVAQIREAIETSDYEALREMVFWKDTGEFKKRIVRFHLNRSLGRPIKSISMEPYPEEGLAGAIATGKLKPNMEVTHAVRVVYDEEPVNDAGKLPTSVFLVGLQDDVYRIGLVNRTGFDDDDD